ncbi:MAG: hypothetical protein OXE43_01255 [Chloroflexi bacterium]|nr:hypothetical protein [Chloroflexota bacterium]
MNPGDTFFGLDAGGHLSMVLTAETPNGDVAVANFTTHDPEIRRCGEMCVVVPPGEHPYPRRDSCISYRHSSLTSLEWLRRGVENRTYTMREPLGSQLLARIRQGALDSPLTPQEVKAAIRQDRPQQ